MHCGGFCSVLVGGSLSTGACPRPAAGPQLARANNSQIPQQNIDTNIFRYPEGSFFEKRSKTTTAQTLRIDYGFSNEVTFNISIPFSIDS